MTGRKYQWLIMGTYSTSWWLEPAPCPTHTLAQALDGVMLTDLLPLATSGEITVSGHVSNHYKLKLINIYIIILRHKTWEV